MQSRRYGMNAIRPLIDLLHEQEDLKGPETPEERFEGDDPRESPNSAETQARARVVMRRLVAQGLQMPPPDDLHELQHQATLAVLSQPVIADRIIGRMFERAAKAWEDANNHGKWTMCITGIFVIRTLGTRRRLVFCGRWTSDSTFPGSIPPTGLGTVR